MKLYKFCLLYYTSLQKMLKKCIGKVTQFSYIYCKPVYETGVLTVVWFI